MTERFPDLPVVWIESGIAWIPFLMQRLDTQYRMRSSECPLLRKLPSDYMRDMYYTTQPMEMPDDIELLETTFRAMNAETQLLWSSDYHWDMDIPSVVWDPPFIDEDAKDILGRTAQKIFKIDVSELSPGLRSRAAE